MVSHKLAMGRNEMHRMRVAVSLTRVPASKVQKEETGLSSSRRHSHG